jgi:hypothetical protein
MPPIVVDEWNSSPCRTIALADNDLLEVAPPAEEVPAEEVPAEEAPAEEVPAEEAPAEEAPTQVRGYDHNPSQLETVGPEEKGDDTYVERSPWVVDRPAVRTFPAGQEPMGPEVVKTIALEAGDLDELSPEELEQLMRAQQHYSNVVMEGAVLAPETGGAGAPLERSSGQRWSAFRSDLKQGWQECVTTLEALRDELPAPVNRVLTAVLSGPRLLRRSFQRLLEPGQVAPIWMLTIAFIAGVTMTFLGLLVVIGLLSVW